MIDFYCNSRGIGDSLLYTQAVHELSLIDSIRVHTRKYRWHGEKYQNNENLDVNPIWRLSSATEVIAEDTIDANYIVSTNGHQHQALNICDFWNVKLKDRIPKPYIKPGDWAYPGILGKSVGIFIREEAEDNPWYFDNLNQIAEVLNDPPYINVYQIDAGNKIIESADQTYKNVGVYELCHIMKIFSCVVGQTTGQTHIARALDIPCFDIWDWRRFKEYTPSVYTSYAYKENHNYYINGPELPNATHGTVDRIVTDIMKEIL